MANADKNWERMYTALAAFKKRHGHCAVQTDSKDQEQLGRWVASQRHRKRINSLRQWQLDKLGFAWSASDRFWNLMFRMLGSFKAKYGHCNVPANSKEYPDLATWVASQRDRRKIGMLRPDRVKQLQGIRFRWSIYRSTRHQPVQSTPPPNMKVGQGAEEEKSRAATAEKREERCYSVSRDTDVQYGGKTCRLWPCIVSY